MKYLYCYRTAKTADSKNIVDCKVFTPRILTGLLLPGESKCIKEIISRIIFQIITFGKAKIFYLSDGTNLVHTSYVVPKCGKFSFLQKDDYEIGPCFTYPQYRGKGIYPAVLKSVCNSVGNQNTTFYMVVDETNIPSIRGIERAGFQKCGIIKVTKITKCYLLTDKL